MSERRRDAGMGILIVSHLLAERERLDPRLHAARRRGGGGVSAFAAVAGSFAREQLRTPLTLVLLVAIPIFFVVIFASVLGDFAEALGGTLAGQRGDRAQRRLGGGVPVPGALAFFQVASSRGADRRLALAGLGAAAGRPRADRRRDRAGRSSSARRLR